MNSTTAASYTQPIAAASRPKLDHKHNFSTIALFVALLLGGLAFMIFSLSKDVTSTGAEPTTYTPFILLGVALFIALAFEFVNG
jgi:PiT family inorganic phosphate transporter